MQHTYGLNTVIADQIIACAKRVHNIMGTGYHDEIYQRCLAIEMRRNNIQFIKEPEMDVFYDGISVGTHKVDYIVENEIMVELKTVTRLDEMEMFQALHCLEAYNKEIGLLINFGTKKLQVKKVYRDNVVNNY